MARNEVREISVVAEEAQVEDEVVVVVAGAEATLLNPRMQCPVQIPRHREKPRIEGTGLQRAITGSNRTAIGCITWALP